MAVQPAEIPWPTDRLALVNKSGNRAAISAIELRLEVPPGLALPQAEPTPALPQAEPTQLEAGMSRAAAAEAMMPLEEDPEDSTDPALVPLAVAVPPAWAREVVAAFVAVAVDGGGKP